MAETNNTFQLFSAGAGVNSSALGGNLPILDPLLHTWYYNDFHNYTAGDWTVTETDSGATEALATGHGGLLLITNTAADNDVTSLQLGTTSFAFAAGRKSWGQFRFACSELTEVDWFMGLASTDTSPIASLPTTYAAFVKDDGAATAVFKTSAGYNSGTLITTANDTYMRLGWYYDGGSTLKLYVNDTATATNTGTFASMFPTADVRLTMAIQAGTTAAETLTVDYALVAFER